MIESASRELTEEDLAMKDLASLTDLLSLKTDHLLVAARCKLSAELVQPLKREVILIQKEIFKRKKVFPEN
jgi:hypothetical protein